MTELRGRILDRESGRALEARVHVRASTGEVHTPPDAIRKVGPGESFFYADGSFAVEVPRGPAEIVVERGTEYRPLRVPVDVPASGAVDLDLPLERWIRLPEEGWYAGNTHVHYDETETRAAERLRADPRVEDLPVFVVSRLQRRDLAYASNVFPIGRHALSTRKHVIDVGEETRHNITQRGEGYGHLMLINLRSLVEPLSRGLLVDDASPDYPPLVDACDEARGQGGVALWCHNGIGMEAPVAAALGRLDGLNLFDPYWMDPEYDIWYALLNCGMVLPASTGSDWFVCSSNRVYVDVDGDFSYESWLDGLRAGRTLITDGPILRLRVDGAGPSTTPRGAGQGTRSAQVEVEWAGVQPLDAIEVLRDGEVAHSHEIPSGELSGVVRLPVDVAEAGWLAARARGRARTSYGHTQWAHTSPVHLRSAAATPIRRAAAAGFAAGIDTASEWIRTQGRFASEEDRARMLAVVRGGARSLRGAHRLMSGGGTTPDWYSWVAVRAHHPIDTPLAAPEPGTARGAGALRWALSRRKDTHADAGKNPDRR